MVLKIFDIINFNKRNFETVKNIRLGGILETNSIKIFCKIWYCVSFGSCISYLKKDKPTDEQVHKPTDEQVDKPTGEQRRILGSSS